MVLVILDKLQDFVNAIDSRTNIFTNLAPNKVTKKRCSSPDFI